MWPAAVQAARGTDGPILVILNRQDRHIYRMVVSVAYRQ
jgi:hypothetical protein